MKERKETLSPTFLQTIASYKSPLTAFGEGLMKVGETNQKIHDTIWEHDLRQERLERERALHDMQVEAHELKMRRENFAQEQDEKYSSAEREAGIANTRANTWNTSENARATKERTNDFLNKNLQEESDSTSIAMKHYDAYGNLLSEGESYIKELERQMNDSTLSPTKRQKAMHDLVIFNINRGRRLGNLSAQQMAQRQWTDDELAAFEFMGISPQLFKYQNGTLQGVNKVAQNQLALLYFVKDNLAPLTALRNGQLKLEDFGEEFQATFKAYAQTYREGMPNAEKYLARRKNMASTAQLLEDVFKDISNVKKSIGAVDNLLHKVQSYTGGTKPSENAIRILHAFYSASRVKEFYGGNASEKDRESITQPIGTLGQDDKKVLSNILTLINNDINAVAYDIDGSNPLIAFAKYGKEYAILSSMRDLIQNELNLKTVQEHGGVDSSAKEKTAQGQGDEQYTINSTKE